MIITKLRIQEELPTQASDGGDDSWPLPYVDFNMTYASGENGYNVKEIVGLGPPDFKGVVVGFDATGIPIKNSVPEDRIIDCKISLNPQLGQSYSSLRDTLYRLIGRTVFVKLMDGSKIVAQTVGYIRKIDPVHFSNRPDLVVSIKCTDSFFTSPTYVTIPSGTLAGSSNPTINYPEGTAPTGVLFTFQNLGGSKTGFYIANYGEFWFGGQNAGNTLFQITYPIDVNDSIILDTNPKTRSVKIYDNSAAVFIDIGGYLNSGAVWPMLYPGVNQWSWDLDWAVNWNNPRYYARYWGV